jgi:hypothetical protein
MIINKFEINDNEIIERDDPPPDHKQYAKMARWLVHNNGKIYLNIPNISFESNNFK